MFALFEKISKHGYKFTKVSTNQEFERIASEYKPIRCIICNSKTKEFFKTRFWSKNIITINNSIPDGVFYFNVFDRKE